MLLLICFMCHAVPCSCWLATQQRLPEHNGAPPKWNVCRQAADHVQSLNSDTAGLLSQWQVCKWSNVGEDRGAAVRSGSFQSGCLSILHPATGRLKKNPKLCLRYLKSRSPGSFPRDVYAVEVLQLDNRCWMILFVTLLTKLAVLLRHLFRY